MKRLLLLTLLLTPWVAKADLLERVKLEDALRARLEQVVRVKDAKAQVLARVEFKSFQTDLPGTSGLKETFVPSKVESSDIARVDVEIYTELKQLPEETKQSLYRIMPVSKDRVKISVKQIEPAAIPAVQKQVEAKDLADIAQQSVQSIETLTKTVLASLAALVIFAMGVIFFYSSRKMKEFKNQFSMLANAISESGGNRGSSQPQLAAPQAITVSPIASSEKVFESLPSSALYELFADCYWCENDGYAHWLWKQLSPEQRFQSFKTLPFMKEYSSYFVQIPPREQSFHEHPFYLNPVSCVQVSMHDVNEVLKKDLSVWHKLSPLRQAATGISLEQKLLAVESSKASIVDWKSRPESPARAFKSQVSIGELTLEDEMLLFQTPDLAPVGLRHQIRSLVWLAHRDQETIKKVLAKFDARSLASVWVAPEAVLKKLEQHVPEKKLKLLLTYRQKENPTRQSPTFEALVEEGLKDEAA
jgi:hypothetical protein